MPIQKIWRKFFATFITRILEFLVDCYNMLLQIAFSRRYVLALITRVLGILVDGFNMSLQICFLFELFATVGAQIADVLILIDSFDVRFRMCSFIFRSITWILESSVN